MSINRRAILAFASAATVFSLFAGAAMAEPDYKDKIRIFYDTFNKNDPALLDQIIAEDWVHIPANTPGEEPGREGFKKLVPGFAATFKDGNIKIEDIVQEGNKVVVRSSYTATQVGPFMGFEPKGRPFTIMTIDVHEFNKDGLVQTTWHLEDWLGGLYQMFALRCTTATASR
ncbi:ester cyclase [Tabrizicola sp. J26]|uniref:ester cyclase n=1 Tax=Alitabrizicola rongguiensis TaxID=2909234 RepID=UPI001F311845|nr:ester cyclase [Tabrizicola rongguiensis]MCF1710283.1 ester cyclase [Tabrizicola rongguiensis]